MGIADKARNKAEELAGQAKEAVGDVTDNDKLKAEGQAEQAAAKAKQAGEGVKDVANDTGEAVKDAFGKR